MYFLGPRLVPCMSLLLVLPPLSGRSLLLWASLSPLLLPSGCVCCLVTCFAFLRVLTWPSLDLFSFFLFFGIVFPYLRFFPAVFRNSVSFFFSLFLQLFLGVSPSSSGFHFSLVAAVCVPLLFFSICFLFSILFPSLLFWYACSSCFLRHLWVSLRLSGCFLRFLLGLHLFFALCSSLFRLQRFGLLLAVFLTASPSFMSLPILYGLRPSFPHPTPTAVLRFYTPPVLFLAAGSHWHSIGCPGAASRHFCWFSFA